LAQRFDTSELRTNRPEVFMTAQTFKELEHGGWTERGAAYDDYFALITNQAIDFVLASFGSLNGKLLLDVCCGTGEVTAAAAERGAEAEGIDFAATMIAIAASKYPGLAFTPGDAEDLPYENERFDCVACCFGLLHLEQPEKAISEAWRVLRHGGRYTFTVWCTPEQGCALFGLIQGAIQAHGTIDVGLPPAPPFFRFANIEECQKTLSAAGFGAPASSIIPLTWHGNSPGDLLELFYKSAVRMPMVLERQTSEARERIHKAVLESAERFRAGDRLAVPSPAFMVTAVKP
jgi:SAM-dependent methyltransferase